MNPIWALGVFVIGMTLGVVYFGGLWLTVRRLPSMQMPALWFLASLLFRLGVVLTSFFAVLQGGWELLAICVFGFLVVRFLLVGCLGNTQEFAN